MTKTLFDVGLNLTRINFIKVESYLAFNEIYQQSKKNYICVNSQNSFCLRIEPTNENIFFDFSSFSAFYRVIEIIKIQSNVFDS